MTWTQHQAKRYDCWFTNFGGGENGAIATHLGQPCVKTAVVVAVLAPNSFVVALLAPIHCCDICRTNRAPHEEWMVRAGLGKPREHRECMLSSH